MELILQHEQLLSQNEVIRLQFLIGTYELIKLGQDVKIQVGNETVQQMIQHTDIISNGEITMDLTQILRRQYDNR